MGDESHALLQRLRGPAPWLAALVVGACALALRVPYLAGIPNPSGDEGNWLWAAQDLALGRAHALLPDGRFVPLTFARAISWVFRLAGEGFAQARAVPVVLSLSSLVCAPLALRGVGPSFARPALALACVLAWHPWSVAWSRSVCVPYAPVLACSVTAVALLFALAHTSPPRALSRWALAWQLLGLGLHGSPFALIPVGAVALWALLDRPARARFASLGVPGALLAFAGVLPHALLVARGALEVAARGTTRPRHVFTALPQRLHTYLRTVLGSVDGEATARHFAGVSLSPVAELLAALVAFGLVVYALGALRPARPSPSPERSLRTLAGAWLACALAGVPVLLLPVRQWNLPAVDAERYGFCFVAPAAFALAALACDARRTYARLALPLALACLAPTLRTARALYAGTAGPDRGAWLLLDGGAYRGWRTPRERRPFAELVRDELSRERRTPGEAVELLVADYAWHTLHFALRPHGIYPVDVTKIAYAHSPGARVFYLLFCREAFAPGYTPANEPAANEALRARMRAPRLVRRFDNPRGDCLAELYEGSP